MNNDSKNEPKINGESSFWIVISEQSLIENLVNFSGKNGERGFGMALVGLGTLPFFKLLNH